MVLLKQVGVVFPRGMAMDQLLMQHHPHRTFTIATQTDTVSSLDN